MRTAIYQMIKKILFPILFIALHTGLNAQVVTPAPAAAQAPTIQWISIEEAIEKCKTEPKKLLVDVYTDWCGWCKRMDATTFQNPVVVQVVNQYYYAVKFDAESKKEIVFNGTVYKFVANGQRGHHELASALLQGKMGYPTVAFLDEKLNLIQSIPGYRKASEIDPILNYFGANYYLTVPWDTFMQEYKSPVVD
jgi:thioredoxin-related protein